MNNQNVTELVCNNPEVCAEAPVLHQNSAVDAVPGFTQDNLRVINPDGYQVGQHRYRISDTGYSSDRYGKCELCGVRASEMYYQVEQVFYMHPPRVNLPNGMAGWSGHGCNGRFGHQNCLEGTRRGAFVKTIIEQRDNREYLVHAVPEAAIAA